MSGHWNKIVNGACKPKHAPPKSKYIDSLVSSTYQSDGSFQDVSRALKMKLRDPNSSVVFKALLVIHTLIRVGNSEEVMNYWSGLDGRDGRSLGLKDVCAMTDTPQNLSRYSNYLLARVRCYSALKHDPIRTRSEAPASLRSSNMNGSNRLRTLTVEKGLLREVGTLQKLMDALVDCKFYLEDTDDDLVMSALRLLVKDLLILFQAVNEGVINVLEHYFEMSHVDATTALKTYKIFCKQCEKVVAYLGVAKKLERIIHVNIPNLRHAPVSLAGSLEEYLNDPNFETNRQEYRENKRIADGGGPSKKSTTPKPITTNTRESAPKEQQQHSSSQPTEGQKAFTDFFESIESEQQSMFNPNSLSPSTAYFQQQANISPFAPQPTGFGMTQNQVFAQPTGFPPPNQAPNSFGRASMGQALFGSLNGSNPPQFLQPQPTGFAPGGQLSPGNQLQPQMTGANPFRQSMFSQPTGMGSFPPQQQQQQPILPQPTGPNNPFSQFTSASNPTGFALGATNGSQDLSSPWGNQTNPIDRSTGAMSAPPISTQPTGPFGFVSNFSSETSPSVASASTLETKLLKPQQTGSRNPFAPPPGSSPPAVPKLPDAPSLNELAASAFSVSMVQQRAREQAAQLQLQQQMQKLESSSSKNQTNGSSEASELKRMREEEEERKKKEFQDFFSKQLNRLEGGGKDIESASKNPMGSFGLFENVASEFAVTKTSNDKVAMIMTKNEGLGEGNSTGVGVIVNQPTGFTGGSLGSSLFKSGSGGNLIQPQVTGIGISNVNGSFSSVGQSKDGFLSSQKTGFGGSTVKPFQPSSSFGTSLAAQVGNPSNGSGTNSTTITSLNTSSSMVSNSNSVSTSMISINGNGNFNGNGLVGSNLNNNNNQTDLIGGFDSLKLSDLGQSNGNQQNSSNSLI